MVGGPAGWAPQDRSDRSCHGPTEGLSDRPGGSDLAQPAQPCLRLDMRGAVRPRKVDPGWSSGWGDPEEVPAGGVRNRGLVGDRGRRRDTGAGQMTKTTSQARRHRDQHVSRETSAQYNPRSGRHAADLATPRMFHVKPGTLDLRTQAGQDRRRALGTRRERLMRIRRRDRDVLQSDPTPPSHPPEHGGPISAEPVKNVGGEPVPAPPSNGGPQQPSNEEACCRRRGPGECNGGAVVRRTVVRRRPNG